MKRKYNSIGEHLTGRFISGARRAVPYALLRVAVVALGGNVVLPVTGDAVLVVDLLGVLNFAMAASTGWIL
jgi:hypothetical protein